MPRRSTIHLDASPESIETAAAALRDGALVAFPTETVYGLGADARDPEAVRAIFAAKGRPATDPLIVHVADLDAARTVGDLDAGDGIAARLGAEFWPGPLSVVVPRLDSVAAEVGGGRDTVAVRVPAHPVAIALLRSAGVPVAAPSANRFGRISPTTAQHVSEELEGRIDVIVDGGPTPLGVESTVVACDGGSPRLLRPGGVPVEALLEVVPDLVVPGHVAAPEDLPAESPGVFTSHYAPRTPVVVVPDRVAAETLVAVGKRRSVVLGILELPVDVSDAARTLYGSLRELDASGVAGIVAVLVDPGGLGRAVNDRLLRAASGFLDAEPGEATLERLIGRV